MLVFWFFSPSHWIWRHISPPLSWFASCSFSSIRPNDSHLLLTGQVYSPHSIWPHLLYILDSDRNEREQKNKIASSCFYYYSTKHETWSFKILGSWKDSLVWLSSSSTYPSTANVVVVVCAEEFIHKSFWVGVNLCLPKERGMIDFTID